MSWNINAQISEGTTQVGTTSGQFLKLGAGARSIGMGGAFTGIGEDIYSVYYNPAGIALMKSNAEVAFNHANWFADMSYDFAAGAVNLDNMGVLFVTFTSFSVPEDKVRTEAYPEGDGRTWDASSVAIGIGYAKSLTDRFSIGGHFKYIREAIWNVSASGFGVDIGTLYRTPFNDLTIGAAITNFGSNMQLDGRDIQFNTDPNKNDDTGPNNIPAVYDMDSYPLPLTFKIGLAMDIVKTRFIRATGAVDAVHPNDNSEYVNSGLELAYDEMFFVRVGYKSLFKDNSEEGLTFGGGLRYKLNDSFKITINYGYADYGRLENVQFFDLGLSF
ncbi:MAG: PorV/PorQ family protein [bacterium]